MIKSRRFIAKGEKNCCANCSRLTVDGAGAVMYKCKIDGAVPEYPDLISICVCDKFKEVSKHGKL